MTAQPCNRVVFVSWSWHLLFNGNQALSSISNKDVLFIFSANKVTAEEVPLEQKVVKDVRMCMIKNFPGAGVVTPSKPPPPYGQLCLYPPPVLRCVWEDPLMTPTPTTPLQASFTATSLPIHHPSPHKNFNHTR